MTWYGSLIDDVNRQAPVGCGVRFILGAYEVYAGENRNVLPASTPFDDLVAHLESLASEHTSVEWRYSA